MVIKRRSIEPTLDERCQIIRALASSIDNWPLKGDIDWPDYFDAKFRLFWRELGLRLIPPDVEIGAHIVKWLDQAFADRGRFVSQVGMNPSKFDAELVARVVLNQVLALVNRESTNVTPASAALMTEGEKDNAIHALMGAIEQWRLRDPVEYREGKMSDARKGQIEHCLEKLFRALDPALNYKLGPHYVRQWIVIPFNDRAGFCGTMYDAELLDELNVSGLIAITVINRVLAFLNGDDPTELREELFMP